MSQTLQHWWRALVAASLLGSPALAQQSPARQDQALPPAHDHAQMKMDDERPETAHVNWHFMQDGAFNATINHQGGPRGSTEGLATNWWMGMWARPFEKRRLTIATMFSLDPLTAGADGYGELFQVGETLDGKPIVDRQHPHDFFMQVSAAWRTPIAERAALTISAAPAGEPALGPVAFMHRASAAAILSAPLTHHLFDSTHASFGVATASLEVGPITLEGSTFNGREPDQDRWDIDFGRLDSVSGRLWLRPTDSLTLQASVGRLVEPEALEKGNATRRTMSVAWWQPATPGFDAVTIGYGENEGHGMTRRGFFMEASRQRGPTTMSTRFEAVKVETNLLLGEGHEVPRTDLVKALTAGVLRDVVRFSRVEGSLGANATFHVVPEVLQASHGEHPMAFQVFVQLRPNPGVMGRMWNGVMGR